MALAQPTASTGKSITMEIGEVVKGELLDAQHYQQADITTGEPLTWTNGQAKMQLVLTLQLPGEEEPSRFYCKPSAEKSLAEFLQKKELQLEVGGLVAIRREPDGVTKTRGHNPPKIYTVEYGAPVAKPAQPTASMM